MSKNNQQPPKNPGNANVPAPKPQDELNIATAAPSTPVNLADEKFRQIGNEAMVEDMMTMPELAPSAVAEKLPPSKGAVPANARTIEGNLAEIPVQTSAPSAQRQILDMVIQGKITPDEGEKLLASIPRLNPAPYIGGVDGPATRDEIRAGVMDAFGDQLQSKSNNQAEMLELVGAMVEKIVRGLREPSEEEKAILERKKKERAQLIKEQFNMIKEKLDIQDMCPHERATIDGKSHSTVTAMHNFVDQVVRGICSLCDKVIEPGDPDYRLVVVSHHLAFSAAASR